MTLGFGGCRARVVDGVCAAAPDADARDAEARGGEGGCGGVGEAATACCAAPSKHRQGGSQQVASESRVMKMMRTVVAVV
eukprot:1968153-Rhodomonas_salina.1